MSADATDHRTRSITLENALVEAGGNAPGLTALRLAAAVTVLMFHAPYLAEDKGHIDRVMVWSGYQTSLGEIALFAFFMISGFLVTASLTSSKSLLAYAYKRVLRIFPALVVVVCFCALVLGPLATKMPLRDYFNDPGFSAYFLNILLQLHWTLPGVFESQQIAGVNGSLWTLPHEVVCYVALGAAGAIGLVRHRGIFALCLLALIVFGWWIKDHPVPWIGKLNDQEIYRWRLLAYFAGGVLVYLYRDHVILNAKLAVAVGLLSLACFVFGLFNLMFPIAGSYLIMVLGMKRGLSFERFGGADYSYGVYLCAFPVQQFVVFMAPDLSTWWFNILISLPITLVLAALSWHVVERPALSLKRRFATRMIPVINAPVPNSMTT